MKRTIKTAALVLALCAVVCFSSCYRPGSLGASGHFESYAIAKYAVPIFVDIGRDAWNFDKVKLLETDDYGRKLFEYNYWLGAFATETAKYATLLIVCQSVAGEKKKDLEVGWYDACWIAKPSTAKEYASFDEKDVEELKKLNDWGKPLDHSKINTAHYYRYDSYKSDAENANYEEDLAKRTEDSNNFIDAANAYYGNVKEVGRKVYKTGLIYSLVLTSDTELFFVCFDPIKKEIKSEERFDGDIFECRDAFCRFMNSIEDR